MSVRGAFALVRLDLAERRGRIIGLAAFAGLFLLAGLVARAIAGEHGHVEMDRLFMLGGYPLASALLLMGWVLGRYPMIAALVLFAGVVSRDREQEHARLLLTRPGPVGLVYVVRALVLGAVAFLLSAVLMPVFDLLLLGTWAGPATFVLAAANVLLFGSLTFLLSVWVRSDAWVALILGMSALVWHGLLVTGYAAPPPPVGDVLTFVLPPAGSILRLEAAFGAIQPIPWDAALFIAGYAGVLALLAFVSLRMREV
jgi:hypothetical protein